MAGLAAVAGEISMGLRGLRLNMGRAGRGTDRPRRSLRCDVWTCRVGIGLLGATYLADAVAGVFWHRAWAPMQVHGDVLHGAVAMIFIGGIKGLKAFSFAPIREAFQHGYLKAREDMAAANPDGARVLHMPLSAYIDSRPPGGGNSGGHLPAPRTHGKHARPTPTRPVS